MCVFCKLEIGSPTCECECETTEGQKYCPECQHTLMSSPSKA